MQLPKDLTTDEAQQTLAKLVSPLILSYTLAMKCTQRLAMLKKTAEHFTQKADA